MILGEPFTKYSIIGTILVCIGAVLIGTFGAIGEPTHTLSQLLLLLQRRPFISWIIITLVLVLGILAGCRVLRFLSSSARLKHLSMRRLQIIHSRVRLVRGMFFGMVSGILSAHTLLLAKSAVELLVRTIVDGVNQFNRWQSWVILIGMIMLALTQLFYLHRGLKLCSTSVLYPFVFCIYNIIAILDGLIYYQEASQVAGVHAWLIALGTIILLSGVLCLSWRLEDIDSHAAVTVVGPSQTGLGPGMGVMEESHDHHPSQDLTDIEEGQVGERQPLLHGGVHARRRSLHQRAPSLPSVSSTPYRSTMTDFDSASIWAELDDSDYEGNADARASLSHRASRPRPRSKSGTLAALGPGFGRRPHRSSTNPINNNNNNNNNNNRNWDPRRISSVLSGKSSPLKWQTDSPEHDPDHPHHHQQQQSLLSNSNGRSRGQHQQTTPSNPLWPSLAGSRDSLANMWRTGVRYVSRWSSQPSRSREDEYGRQLPDLE